MTSRIVIVEDEDSIALALRVLLEREGLEVARMADGAVAAADMAGMAPDLVLLDAGLPGMGGFAVCETLRAGGAPDALPIVMMSAAGGPHAADRACAAGADAFLAKPFDAADLLSLVRRLLKSGRPAKAGGSHA